MFACGGSRMIACGTYLDSPSEVHNCSCSRRKLHEHQRLCRSANVTETRCNAFVRAQCAELAHALRRPDKSDAFEPWRLEPSILVTRSKRTLVDQKSNAWKYHICGAPPRRSKSWAGLLLKVCTRGQSAASRCHAARPSVSKAPILPTNQRANPRAQPPPPLPPLVRGLLEQVALRVVAEVAATPQGEGSCFVCSSRNQTGHSNPSACFSVPKSCRPMPQPCGRCSTLL